MPEEKQTGFDPQTEKEQVLNMEEHEGKLQEEYKKPPEEPERKPLPSLEEQAKGVCNCGPDQKLVQSVDKNKETIVECLECGQFIKVSDPVSGISMKEEAKSELTGK